MENLEEDFNVLEDLETPEEHERFLLEMANVRGKSVKVEDIDFSFYISTKGDIQHAIRIKICWNRERMQLNTTGILQLHGDYEYFNSPNSNYKPKKYEVETVRYFGKKYKVLFAAVWEDKLDASDLAAYFTGYISWQELMKSFMDIDEEVLEVIANCRGLKDLEFAVRKNNAFNMND